LKGLAAKLREAISWHIASIEKSGVAKVIRANSSKLDRSGGPVRLISNLDQAYLIHTKQWPHIELSRNGDLFDGTWVGDKKIWQMHDSSGVGRASKRVITDREAVKLFKAIFNKAETGVAEGRKLPDDVDRTQWSPDTDTRGKPLKPGDYVSVSLYRGGTEHGWLKVSDSEWAEIRQDGSWKKVLQLVVVTKDGTVYGTARTLKMRKQLPMPKGLKEMTKAFTRSMS